jgi:hypothetical protein
MLRRKLYSAHYREFCEITCCDLTSFSAQFCVKILLFDLKIRQMAAKNPIQKSQGG